MTSKRGRGNRKLLYPHLTRQLKSYGFNCFVRFLMK
jgi:hypothetical protein